MWTSAVVVPPFSCSLDCRQTEPADVRDGENSPAAGRSCRRGAPSASAAGPAVCSGRRCCTSAREGASCGHGSGGALWTRPEVRAERHRLVHRLLDRATHTLKRAAQLPSRPLSQLTSNQSRHSRLAAHSGNVFEEPKVALSDRRSRGDIYRSFCYLTD